MMLWGAGVYDVFNTFVAYCHKGLLAAFTKALKDMLRPDRTVSWILLCHGVNILYRDTLSWNINLHIVMYQVQTHHQTNGAIVFASRVPPRLSRTSGLVGKSCAISVRRPSFVFICVHLPEMCPGAVGVPEWISRFPGIRRFRALGRGF